MSDCSATGCQAPVKARGYCGKHLHRLYRGRAIESTSVYEKTDAERFWEQVTVAGVDECWLWTGYTRGTGKTQYGWISLRAVKLSAHRHSYELANGPIPAADATCDFKGFCVLHRCDNTMCVNPAHLFLGTHTDNMKDKTAKGRDWQTQRTHCPHGHEYSAENTHVNVNGSRVCRRCACLRARSDRQLKRVSREQRGVTC